MYNFEALESILNDMDFKQLRGLQASDGHRATDEAIHFFVNQLVAFFSQSSEQPTPEELICFEALMKKITIKINEAEYAHYLNKYKNDTTGDYVGIEDQVA
jgi:hypothetical protein